QQHHQRRGGGRVAGCRRSGGVVFLLSGILSSSTLFAACALRFGFRVVCSDVHEPCKPLLFERKNAISACIRRSSAAVNVAIDNKEAMAVVHDQLQRHQWQEWQSNDIGCWQLKGLKLSSGPSLYLLHDGRRLATLRARLRFNRCSLRASLAERRLSADPNCEVCAVPETVEHCLLVCPRYTIARQECAAALDLHRLPLTLASALGSLDDAGPGVRRAALATTGRYLLAIDNIRHL